MFVCDDCSIKNNWNMALFKSIGSCEVCGEVKSCSDVHHSKLDSEPFFTPKPANTADVKYCSCPGKPMRNYKKLSECNICNLSRR